MPRPFLALIALLTFTLLSTLSSQAATLLSVDFGGGAIQSGFTQWSIGGDGSSIRTTTLGGYGLTVAGGVTAADLTTLNTNYSLNERNRDTLTNSGDFTMRNLYLDRIVATVAAGKTAEANSGLLLQLSGFEANTQYEVQLWGYEHNNRGTTKFVNFYDLTTGTEELLGGYNTGMDLTPTNNNDFSITKIVTSDAEGNIILKSRSNYDGIGIYNGITVSQVPEPGIATLTLIGTTAIFLRRRRVS